MVIVHHSYNGNGQQSSFVQHINTSVLSFRTCLPSKLVNLMLSKGAWPLRDILARWYKVEHIASGCLPQDHALYNLLTIVPTNCAFWPTESRQCLRCPRCEGQHARTRHASQQQHTGTPCPQPGSPWGHGRWLGQAQLLIPLDAQARKQGRPWPRTQWIWPASPRSACPCRAGPAVRSGSPAQLSLDSSLVRQAQWP